MAANDFKTRNGINANGDITANGTLYLNIGSDAAGDLYTRAANGAFARIAIGANGTVLSVNSTGGYEYLTAESQVNTVIGNDEINPAMINTAARFESTQYQQLHINNASSGGSVDSTADDLIIENSTNAGITISTPNTSIGRINFGDPQASQVGSISFNHGNNTLELLSAGASRFWITASQITSNIGTVFHSTDGWATHAIQGNTTTGANLNLGDGTNSISITYNGTTTDRRDYVDAVETMRSNTIAVSTLVNAAFDDSVLTRDTTTDGTGIVLRSNNYTTVGYVGVVQNSVNDANSYFNIRSAQAGALGGVYIQRSTGTNVAIFQANGTVAIGDGIHPQRTWGALHVKTGNSTVNGLATEGRTVVIEGATAGLSILAGQGDESSSANGPSIGYPSISMTTPISNTKIALDDFNGTLNHYVDSSLYMAANATGISSMVINPTVKVANSINRSAIKYLGKLDLSNDTLATFDPLTYNEPGGNAMYDSFIFRGTGILPTDDAVNFFANYGNSTSWGGNGRYNYISHYTNTTAMAIERQTTGNRNFITPAVSAAGAYAVGNAVGEGLSFEMHVFGINYSADAEYKSFTKTVFKNPTDETCLFQSAVSYTSVNDVTRMRFGFNTGNIALGTIRMYGVKAEDFNEGVA